MYSLFAGKSSLIDCLMSKAPGMESATAEEGQAFNLDNHSVLSVVYGKHLINVTSPPGHTDVQSSAVNELCLADGAILVVDSTTEFQIHPAGLLCHAIREKIKPVLCIDIRDMLLRSDLSGEELYQILFHVIQNVNKVLSNFEDKALGDIIVSPVEGTVVFINGIEGWGFTLSMIEKLSRTTSKEDDLPERLWGENFFDPVMKQWSNERKSESCERGFIKHCYEPLKKIIDSCMSDKKRFHATLKEFGAKPKDHWFDLTSANLVKQVLKELLPAGVALTKMVIQNLPSPKTAQLYQFYNLYPGPLNDKFATAIRDCDPNGPLIVYVPKTVPSQKMDVQLLSVVSCQGRCHLR